MLDAGANVLRLDPLDHGGREPAGQIRVLGEVLEVAPAQRRALDVDSWTQHHGNILCACLRSQRGTRLSDQVGIPARTERRRRGETRRGQPGAGELAGLLAETVRPVGQRDRLDTGLGDPRGTPVVPAQAEPGLLGGTELVNPCDLRYAGHTRRNSSTCQGIGPASGTSRMNS